MRTVLAVALSVIIGVIIGVIGERYLRSPEPVRTFPSWQIVAQPGAGYHAWRLHTVTGEMDFCGIEDNGNWQCLPVSVWTTGHGGNTPPP